MNAETAKYKRPNVSRIDDFKCPIRKAELNQARKVRIGTKIKVFNHNKSKDSDTEVSFGEWEMCWIVEKYSHIVRLSNGMCVDYAEIAMQRRERNAHSSRR